MAKDVFTRWQVVETVEAMHGKGLIILSPDQQAQMIWLKTALQYEFSLRNYIRDLYRTGYVGLGEYIDNHARLIREQFGRAWREGMRDVGIDPDEMTDEEQIALAEQIDQEDDFVLNFAEEIIIASINGMPVQPYLNRAAVWANRYRDIVNMAKIMAGKDQKLEWVLGPTEHCDSCQKLAGVVKRGSMWERAGIRPQNAPNGLLECGGWNCQCELAPTNKPVRKGKFPRLP